LSLSLSYSSDIESIHMLFSGPPHLTGLHSLIALMVRSDTIHNDTGG
jgi:hypothetical protein